MTTLTLAKIDANIFLHVRHSNNVYSHKRASSLMCFHLDTLLIIVLCKLF